MIVNLKVSVLCEAKQLFLEYAACVSYLLILSRNALFHFHLFILETLKAELASILQWAGLEDRHQVYY